MSLRCMESKFFDKTAFYALGCRLAEETVNAYMNQTSVMGTVLCYTGFIIC